MFLLDEPIQQLDPHHQIETLRLFRHQADAGRLVVMSLHDVGLAARYADDAILLYGDGRWLHGTACPPSTGFALSLNAVACCPTKMTCWIIIDAQRPMRIAFSRAQSRASFPSRLQ